MHAPHSNNQLRAKHNQRTLKHYPIIKKTIGVLPHDEHRPAEGSPPGNELNNMGLGVMASIRLEDEARKDPRFGILGKRMGTSKFDARARMEELWAYCTEKQTYFLSAEIIDELAEFPNFSHLICEPEVSLAEACSEGIRIKGTKGRIEWIAKLRKNGKKGGRPRKTKTKPEANQTETRIEPPSNPLTLTLTPVLTTTLVNNSLFPDEQTEQQTRKRATKKRREPEPRGAIQEFGCEPLLTEVLGDVTQLTQRTWLATYSDAEWIRKEILRAVAWYSEKGEVVARWGQAISTWLARSWERKPKTLQFAPGSTRTKKELPPEVAAQFEEQDRMRREMGLD